MYQCKHARTDAVHKHTKSKILISLLAMALVCCVSISGTLAWVMYQTNPVVNTFTYGDIHITLEETGATEDTYGYTNDYTMVPGFTIEKDPTVTVLAGSEDCWLFVQLEKSDNFDQYLTYEREADWHKLRFDQSTTTGSSVYYRIVEQQDVDQPFNILKDNTVQVRTTVTKEMLNQLGTDDTYPTLTVTAYAVQTEGLWDDTITDPAERNEQALDAWDLIASEYLE